MIKLSVNEKNEVFCWPEPALLLILYFDLNICFRARKVIATLDKRPLVRCLRTQDGIYWKSRLNTFA